MKVKWILPVVTVLVLSTLAFIGFTYNNAVMAAQADTNQGVYKNSQAEWTLGPAMCFDLYRLDGEYYAGTGLVYFLGGRIDGTTTTGIIYTFDPISGECLDSGVVMPNPISNYTVNLVNDGLNDLLCTFGGRQSDGTQTLNVQCLNPNDMTVSVVTNMPDAWAGYVPGAQVVVDNKVYIFGGFNPSVGVIARTEVYDPTDLSFTQLGDLSLARSYIMATKVEGIIYAFGGDTWDGASLIAQSTAEKMDPAVGIWDDAGVADMPDTGDEGQAFGFEPTAPYELSNQIVIATLSKWSGNSNEVILYDIDTDTYDMNFPNTINARRNHAGVFVPLVTGDPTDGLPGMWVFGGWLTGDAPPFAPAEFYPMEEIEPQPNIVVVPASLEATLLPGETITASLTIRNRGQLPLDWDITDDATWLSEDPTNGSIQAGKHFVVEVTFDATGLEPGDYNATLSVNSNDPDTPVAEIPVLLSVPGPEIVITPASLEASLLPTDTITKELTIGNTGPLPLDWDITDDAAWLSEDPTSGSVDPDGSEVVVVKFDSTGLSAGVYTATLSVSSNDPKNPVVDVPVEMTVLPQADLTITKLDSPDPVRQGFVFTYTLIATNEGPYDATGVKIKDTLPISVTYVDSSDVCTKAAGVVTCNVGNIAVGDAAGVTVTVTSDVLGEIINTATVTGVENDPKPDNNADTQITTVIPPIFEFYLPLVMKQ